MHSVNDSQIEWNSNVIHRSKKCSTQNQYKQFSYTFQSFDKKMKWKRYRNAIMINEYINRTLAQEVLYYLHDLSHNCWAIRSLQLLLAVKMNQCYWITIIHSEHRTIINNNKNLKKKTIKKWTHGSLCKLVTRLQLALNCGVWNFSSEINMKLIRDKWQRKYKSKWKRNHTIGAWSL